MFNSSFSFSDDTITFSTSNNFDKIGILFDDNPERSKGSFVAFLLSVNACVFCSNKNLVSILQQSDIN